MNESNNQSIKESMGLVKEILTRASVSTRVIFILSLVCVSFSLPTHSPDETTEMRLFFLQACFLSSHECL